MARVIDHAIYYIIYILYNLRERERERISYNAHYICIHLKKIYIFRIGIAFFTLIGLNVANRIK